MNVECLVLRLFITKKVLSSLKLLLLLYLTMSFGFSEWVLGECRSNLGAFHSVNHSVSETGRLVPEVRPLPWASRGSVSTAGHEQILLYRTNSLKVLVSIIILEKILLPF